MSEHPQPLLIIDTDGDRFELESDLEVGKVMVSANEVRYGAASVYLAREDATKAIEWLQSWLTADESAKEG